MASIRRMGVENSQTRAQLLEAAEEIIRDEGFGALTARRLAEKVALKRQIVHYYFGTIDEVLLAVIRRGGERTRARLQRALESDHPLQVIWRDGHIATPASLEFIALAARHEGARAAIKQHIEEIRGMLAQALARELELRGIRATIPPAVATLMLMSISQTLALETALGVSATHAETRALLDAWIRTYIGQEIVLERPAHQKMSSKRASRGRRPSKTQPALPVSEKNG